MQGNEQIKAAIREHRSKIEVFQWAVTSAVASLVYSEYISKMRQKTVPVRHVQVPAIKYVEELLAPNGKMMEYISDHLLDDIMNDELFQKYADAPELELFKEEYLDAWKSIFDLYVIQNISRHVPSTVAKKFGLDDDKQQLFRQSSEIDLFSRKPLASDRYSYLVHETVLQLLILLPSIEKTIITPENNQELDMSKSRILTIGNPNAICPIHLDCEIMVMSDTLKLIEYVTNSRSTSTYNPDSDIAAMVDDEIMEYRICTSPFNQTSITRLGKIIDLKGEEKGT